MNNNETQHSNFDTLNVMKELSDIKSSLSVNTSETQNIKQSIQEIKIDIKEIKNDYVARREFNETIAAVREEISPLKKFVYTIIGFLGLAVLGAIINLVIKQ